MSDEYHMIIVRFY